MNQKMKKGMSLVEVVVAMTVVVLISFAALSAVMFGVNSIENQQYRQYAVNEAENIISCLQSDDPNEALNHAFPLAEEFELFAVEGEKKTFTFCFPKDYYTSEEARVSVFDHEPDQLPSDCVVSVTFVIDKLRKIEEVRADAFYIQMNGVSLRRAFSYFPNDTMQIECNIPYAEAPEGGDAP